MEKWGTSLIVDVMNCDPATIRSKEKIQDYVIQLCKLIEMTRHGDCQIVHFGTGNKEGYSMVQLIETSCITGHFANDINAAFIDIFSCKDFNSDEVEDFTRRFFGSNLSSSIVTDRNILK
jgi:S-adenosylmethionine/arginine decarboxylase-like enzyme